MKIDNHRAQLTLPFDLSFSKPAVTYSNNLVMFHEAKAVHERSSIKQQERKIIDNIVNLSKRLSW